MAALFLSAAHKSSGKTTLSIGIAAALAARGLKVQPFKKGPDYIDPIWLGMAAGRPCYNLDFYIAGKTETVADYCRRGANADLCLIEGNKGLHDGLDLDGSNSNAALAKALHAPVIMVVDARGTMRGIAPLLIGYQVFDREVHIAGVIANLTGGERHEAKLRAAVEAYTDIPFLGALGNDPAIALDERHLGLIPGYEDSAALDRIQQIARAVGERVDLDRLLDIADQARGVTAPLAPLPPTGNYRGLRIGIARDRAFGFYYPGDLEAFADAGAELVPIDTLRDERLPAIDGLWLGGGFPERHAAELEANRALRGAIRAAIDGGLPTYAECGGLMYLARRLRWNDEARDMVGTLAADAVMCERSQGRGYVNLAEIEANHPWPGVAIGGTLYAHEFHYSRLEAVAEDSRFAFDVERGRGITGRHDGLVQHNLLAAYSHQRHTAANPWVTRFLAFVQSCQRATDPEVAAARSAGS